MNCSVSLLTSHAPGPVAVIALHGDLGPVLTAITGKPASKPGTVAVRRLGGIDAGVVTRISEQLVHLMPHGGPRVVSRLLDLLSQLGCDLVQPGERPMICYPEAADECEALMLHALARAASPLAIPLLLDQPARWRTWDAVRYPIDLLRDQAARLGRLLTPPIVALVGPVNVGKSTLTNAIAGRSASITADDPGTTRDYVGVLVDLSGLVVTWIDTPGLREAADPLEAQAVELARGVVRRADLVVFADDSAEPASSEVPGESLAWLPRVDLRLRTKCDLAPSIAGANGGLERPDSPLACSALTGEGLAELSRTITEKLAPKSDLEAPGPWLFDERLIAAAGGGS